MHDNVPALPSYPFWGGVKCKNKVLITFICAWLFRNLFLIRFLRYKATQGNFNKNDFINFIKSISQDLLGSQEMRLKRFASNSIRMFAVRLQSPLHTLGLPQLPTSTPDLLCCSSMEPNTAAACVAGPQVQRFLCGSLLCHITNFSLTLKFKAAESSLDAKVAGKQVTGTSRFFRKEGGSATLGRETLPRHG